jgi:hypothetical protein
MSKVKRVFMFANYTPSDDSIGITKKIRSEIRTLREMGMEVCYTGYENDAVAVFDNNDEVILRKPYPFPVSLFKSKVRYSWLEKTALDYLKIDGNFDLGYFRLGPPNGLLFKMFEELKKNGTQIVAESLAYFPGIKYTSLGGKYIMYCFDKNGHRFKDFISYFLCEGNFTEMFNVPAYTMNMGVDVEHIVPHNYQGDTSELNLISVANENVYHAYDRIIESVHAYQGDKRVKVHLVGTITDASKAIISKYGLEEQVILYGKRRGKELDEIYDKCNVGLGPFGQHRVGGKKDTGLKTKEYFAKGLPYIFSGEEPTVPSDYPYICKFPSDESPIDFDKVWGFYQSYVDDPNVIPNMRSFAFKNYSWHKIMEDALSHLKL